MHSKMAMITFFGEGEYPGHDLPSAPVYPSHGLPSVPGVWPPPGYPSHGLPGLPPGAVQLPVFPYDPTKPDNTLPGEGGERPDNSLPGMGRPDNTLPGSGRPSHPIAIVPGARFIVKWIACIGLCLVPDNSLPGNPAQPKD